MKTLHFYIIYHANTLNLNIGIKFYRAENGVILSPGVAGVGVIPAQFLFIFNKDDADV